MISSEQIQGLKRQGPLAIDGGFLTVPEAPGLGLEPDWAALEQNALAIA